MLEYAKKLLAFFSADLADFIAEDSNYSSPFDTDWESAMQAAELIPTAEQRDDELTQLTQKVELEMTNCRDVFQGMKRYIKKAFPVSPEHWNEFGFDDYDGIRDKQPVMIQFMKRLHTTATKYAAQLTDPAVNFSAARIAEIETRANALDKANNEQEVFKKNRLTYTRERVEAYNAVWNTCTDVANTGKFIYRNQYDKYQHYLLPASEEQSPMLLSGIITDSVTSNPIEEATTELVEYSLQNESDSLGKYGFGNPPEGAATLRISHPLYATQEISVTISTEPQIINVQLVGV